MYIIVRSLKLGDTQRKLCTRNVFVLPLHFLALQVQLVVLMSAFVVVSTVFCKCSICCSTDGAPHAQPFVKVGEGMCPHVQPFIKVGRTCTPVPYGVGTTLCDVDVSR